MKPIAYEGSENYIFISYAHKDSEAVYPVLNMLQQNNYRFWYDDGIAPGSEWPENIAQHLNGSALVIAFVSPNSMASPNCRREINYALSKNKPFLSVFLEPTEMPPGMEMQLSAQQSIFRYNYSSWEGFCRKLLMTPDLDSARIPEASAAPADVPPQQPPKAAPAVPPEPPKKKKSKLPLILGGIGLAAIIAAVVLIVLLSGSKKESAKQGAITEDSLLGTYYFVDFTDDTYQSIIRNHNAEQDMTVEEFRKRFKDEIMQNANLSSMRSFALITLSSENVMTVTMNAGYLGLGSEVGTWRLENDTIHATFMDTDVTIGYLNNQLHVYLPANVFYDVPYEMEIIFEK